MARNTRNANEDQAPEVYPVDDGAVPPTDPTAAPAEKKPRKPRGANAPKGPTFTDAELQRFAAHIAADLKAARLDESVSDDAMFDLFTLDKKLKAMTGGGNVANS